MASHYDGAIKELIRLLKFQHAVDAAEALSELATPLLASHDFDSIVSVPAAPSRYRTRGYNQAELIALAIARKSSLPYFRPLVRLGNARQLGQSRLTRIEQMNQAFAIKRKANTVLRNTRVLLVDDVLTTGATMNACATQLKQAGAKSVWGAVVAKH